MFKKKQHIHFVGIGGIGMSGIAEVLINLGHKVSGSDLRESETTRNLIALKALISYEHRSENVAGADVVVVSSAVSQSNPEVEAARREFIPVIPRAEMLAELMRLKYAVAVAGSHGKTTTTSLVGTIFGAAELDPTLVIGGKLGSIGSNARLGSGDFLVAEADESDGSFLLLSPTIAVVTNIDLEHLDYYRDLEHLKETFLAFVNRVPFYGSAVLCLDDSNVQSLIPRLKKRYLTYGFSTQADVQAVDLTAHGHKSRYNLVYKGERLGQINLDLPGRHNVLNSLAAAGVALDLDVPFDAIKKGMDQIGIIHRRFEIKGEASGVVVIDDYGHHPTEIRTTLAALKECYPDRRAVVVFQPHRYSRTKALFEEFTTAFNQADRMFLTDIYAASEKPIEGITGQALFESIRAHGYREAFFEPDINKLAEAVVSSLDKGDVVMTLGAGSISRLGEEILRLLKDGAGN
ncbi:MAG: UDP-N-acetylmuramate--L-alanine ligase [Deltaproteobacteria bacterium]|nr:UDP-N-acetylmuramate--L-alanine ligase [Deltaproteobacteria bacterium]